MDVQDFLIFPPLIVVTSIRRSLFGCRERLFQRPFSLLNFPFVFCPLSDFTISNLFNVLLCLLFLYQLQSDF